MSVLLCVNSNGTEKLKPLVIGKSKKRCFGGVKSLPVIYEHDTKSWMTGSISEDWLHRIDQKFHSVKRKIFLFVDNCPAHPSVTMKELRAVKVALLPPNTTTKLQTLDQGFIKNLKHHYHKRTVRKVLDRIDDGKVFDITLLDCVMELDKVWYEVTSGTISNCFKNVRICKDEGV
jgi:hypothetical protein